MPDTTLSTVSDAIRHVCLNLRDIDYHEVMACRPYDDPLHLAEEMIGMKESGLLAFIHVGRHNGDPVALICGIPMTPRCLSVGMFATEQWPLVSADFTRWVKRRLIPGVVAKGFARAECRALETNTVARDWLIWLGFRMECTGIRQGKSGERFTQFAYEVT